MQLTPHWSGLMYWFNVAHPSQTHWSNIISLLTGLMYRFNANTIIIYFFNHEFIDTITDSSIQSPTLRYNHRLFDTPTHRSYCLLKCYLSQQIKQLYKHTALEVFLLLINMLSFSADKAVIQRHCIRGILTVY